MWMSECIIVVDRNNPDSNNIADIVAAVGDVGQVLQANEHEYVIEAAVPAHEVPPAHLRSFLQLQRRQPAAQADAQCRHRQEQWSWS